MSTPRTPPDQEHRDRAVAARGVNVLVDAGAGTGKTTLLVRRLVELVAPPGDGPAFPLSRLAAVTFTRKAAGELRGRVRERLLAGLTKPESALQRERLSQALADSDTAFIGTIHGFADRLLRLRPIEARLSPSYRIVEDPDALLRETFELLLQATEAGRLAEELGGTGCDAARAAEAEDAIRAALDAEVRPQSEELEWTIRSGLDALFAGFILHRDVPPPDLAPGPLDRERVLQGVRRFRELAAASRGSGKGSRWMAAVVGRLTHLESISGDVELYREVGSLVRLAGRDDRFQMRRDFPGDKPGWEAWKAWRGDKASDPGLRGAITGPLHGWMGRRLVRAFPAVVGMYEKVKTRHQAVDQVDLLLRLRDLLRDHREVRGALQGLFDHVFVDEFQDTDPLQAEIVLFLCEDGARAGRWDEVSLAPGKLTLVGDPKQSIYRFRRADISVYEAVRSIVARREHVLASLTVNFRSEPALVEHLNARFDELLGTRPEGAPAFDTSAGAVANQRLDVWRAPRRAACVKVLPLATAAGDAAADRHREAEVLAAWIRAAVERREEVVDPGTGQARPLGHGDVAILAHATANVGLLLDALDRQGVPWSARGGKLFLEDPLHRLFLLALRAVADRDDGPAQAAVLRPPFFALDLADLVRAKAATAEQTDEGIARARAATAFVTELRRGRLERPPGETARDLLDRTGFARAAALGPNGLQRLERLRELCFELERLAAVEGLDYDAASARLRGWAVAPVNLDPPRSVGGDAVQVMTIHQAKGLEFPVVALWDAHAPLAPRSGGTTPWFVERGGGSWALCIDQLSCEEPDGSNLLARERAFQASERRRLVYVAATRARDLLVLPVVLGSSGAYVTTALRGADSPASSIEEPWTDAGPPAWAREVEAPPERALHAEGALAGQVEDAWSVAAGEAAAPRLVPRGVAAEAHQRGAARGPMVEASEVVDPGEGEAGARRERTGRFGPEFGETVHLAIGAALREPALTPARAVERAARETGLAVHLAEAAEDVARTLAALEREHLRRPPGEDLRLEYPVATGTGAALLTGYVDLLAAGKDELIVLDFKTDRPPEGDVTASHPTYVEQVRSYARMLVALGLAEEGRVRGGLLFTGDGRVRWL